MAKLGLWCLLLNYKPCGLGSYPSHAGGGQGSDVQWTLS